MILTRGIVLGNHVPCEGTKVVPTEIEVICNPSTQTCQKHVYSLLGYVGYYYRFLEKFTQVESPLFCLLTKYKKLYYTSKIQLAFGNLKEKLSTTPIL